METKNTNVVYENNAVALSGVISSEAQFSHEVYGEKFYSYKMNVERLSNNSDEILLTVSERLKGFEDLAVGAKVVVIGQFRSYNKRESGKRNHLLLYVFVREIKFVENIEENVNQITLEGYVCKEAVYRKTPLGREITDLLLAVNRPYGKSDYIPCICWGRNAKYVSGLNVGQKVLIQGRIQSRDYFKKISEEEVEKRVAYEVSVSKVELGTEE